VSSKGSSRRTPGSSSPRSRATCSAPRRTSSGATSSSARAASTGSSPECPRIRASTDSCCQASISAANGDYDHRRPAPPQLPAGARYAYVPHVLWDAQRGENQLSITRRPLPGDLPVFDLDGDGVADHVGMFDDWTGQPGTTFCTIEGNVTSSGEPNGGRIAQL